MGAKSCHAGKNGTLKMTSISSPEENASSKILKLIWSLMVLAVAVAPVLAAFLVFRGSPSSASTPSYIFYKPNVNHTKIVEATTINNFERVLFGTTKDLLNQVIASNSLSRKPTTFYGMFHEVEL